MIHWRAFSVLFRHFSRYYTLLCLSYRPGIENEKKRINIYLARDRRVSNIYNLNLTRLVHKIDSLPFLLFQCQVHLAVILRVRSHFVLCCEKKAWKRLKDAKFERREIINSVSHEGGRRLWRFSSEHNRQQCDDRLGKNLRSEEIYVTFPLFLTLFHAPYFPVSTDPTPFAYYPYLPVIKNNTKKFEKSQLFHNGHLWKIEPPSWSKRKQWPL